MVIPMKQLSSERSKQSVTQHVIATFKRLMAEGVISPGCRLPTERELAQILGVSRSSLRQALKVLEIMGVISQRVRRGTFLGHGAVEILAEPMEFLILMNGISFQEVVEARLIVEPELAAQAAIRSTAADLARIKLALHRMVESRNRNKQLIEQDLAFHRAIFDAAGNRLTTIMFSVLHSSLQELIMLTSKMVDLEHTMRFHKRIYAAIARRDPEPARLCMKEHLEDVRELLVRANQKHAKDQIQDRIGLFAGERSLAKSPLFPRR